MACNSITTGALLVLFALALSSPAASESVCYGTTANGMLEGGVALPAAGENFQCYSTLGNLLGRNYVHSRVARVVGDAYTRLKNSHPDKVFMYGETGWKEGGRFRPHKTHQNGLSVDFMVPVLDGRGRSTCLPTGVTNKFGYAVEFDDKGRYKGYTIDFEALAAHLLALHRAALAEGIDIARVIFAPELQPYLFQTADGTYLRKHLQFSRKRAWIRHDEHYHVDFKVACRPL